MAPNERRPCTSLTPTNTAFFSNMSNPLSGSVSRTPTGANLPTRPSRGCYDANRWGITSITTHIVCSHLHLSELYLLTLTGTSLLSLFFWLTSPHCSPTMVPPIPPPAHRKESFQLVLPSNYGVSSTPRPPNETYPEVEEGAVAGLTTCCLHLHWQHTHNTTRSSHFLWEFESFFFWFNVHRSHSQCPTRAPPLSSGHRPHALVSNHPNIKEYAGVAAPMPAAQPLPTPPSAFKMKERP